MILKTIAYGIFDILILSPLSILYSFVIVSRNLLFDFNVLKSSSLPRPVISVGNITAGGSGKTPVVMLLLQHFADKKIAVLSRGYGSQIAKKRQYPKIVDTALRPEYYGDEPSLIYSKFNQQTVVLDSQRHQGGMWALKQNPNLDFFILDDGFQHRRLKRTLDVVILDAHTLISKPGLLPKGRLREGMPGLKRANFILLSKWQHLDKSVIEKFEKRIQLFSKAPVSYLNFEIQKVVDLNHQILDSDFRGKIVAFSGVGSPDVFLQDLKKYFSDAEVVKFLKYKDHHQFVQKDIDLIQDWAHKHDAKIICTEKDHIKLQGLKLSHSIFVAEQRISVEGDFLTEVSLAIASLENME